MGTVSLPKLQSFLRNHLKVECNSLLYSSANQIGHKSFMELVPASSGWPEGCCRANTSARRAERYLFHPSICQTVIRHSSGSASSAR